MWMLTLSLLLFRMSHLNHAYCIAINIQVFHWFKGQTRYVVVFFVVIFIYLFIYLLLFLLILDL